jgi:predicted ATP-grasp superfamily ATP-dependent carboligase
LKVIVTDGNNRAALAITRALGREGHQVIVGAPKIPSLASTSRYCAKSFIYPDPAKASADYISIIHRVVKEEKPDVLLPVSDITTMLIAEDKAELERYCAVPFPPYASVKRAADKSDVMKLAEQLNVPTPQTLYVYSAKDAEEWIPACTKLGYPVVVKPARSRVRNGNAWKSFGVSYARDLEELKDILSELDEKGGYPVLLQERIFGDSLGLFLLMDKGEVTAAFAHRRLREKPPSGGVSVLRESAPLNALLKEYSESLLRALDWQGIAMVEFKQDRRSGEFKLMEINGRFWGSLQLAIDAGINFPMLLARTAVGKATERVYDYRIGVKSRWLWGDVDALLAILFKTGNKLNLPEGHPGRVRTLIDFLHMNESNTRYEVLDKDDMKPWLHETRCWLFSRD